MLKLAAMKYKVLEGIAIADVVYEVYGNTIEELFSNAAEAVTQTMVDVETLKANQNVKMKMQNRKLEDLFLDFLNELVYLKDAKQLLFSKFTTKISQQDSGGYNLIVSLWGEKIDPKKHHLRVDVKAITQHKFSLAKKNNKHISFIVLDI